MKRKIMTRPVGSFDKTFFEFLKDIDLGFQNKKITLEQALTIIQTKSENQDKRIAELEKKVERLTNKLDLIEKQIDVKLTENLTYTFGDLGGTNNE